MLQLLRRKWRRVLTEFHRQNITVEVVDAQAKDGSRELLLVFRSSKWGSKPFAEVKYRDVCRVHGLFNDAERWIHGALKKEYRKED